MGAHGEMCGLFFPISFFCYKFYINARACLIHIGCEDKDGRVKAEAKKKRVKLQLILTSVCAAD